VIKKKKEKILDRLIQDLTAERLMWNNKLSKIDIKDAHKSYYTMGVIGGIIIAINLLKRRRDV
jgi:hypothetical protein